MTAIVRKKGCRRGERANRSADLTVKGIDTAAALLLQFADVLQGEFPFGGRLRHELGLDFSPLTADFHHIFFGDVTGSRLGSHLDK